MYGWVWVEWGGCQVWGMRGGDAAMVEHACGGADPQHQVRVCVYTTALVQPAPTSRTPLSYSALPPALSFSPPLTQPPMMMGTFHWAQAHKPPPQFGLVSTTPSLPHRSNTSANLAGGLPSSVLSSPTPMMAE